MQFVWEECFAFDNTIGSCGKNHFARLTRIIVAKIQIGRETSPKLEPVPNPFLSRSLHFFFSPCGYHLHPFFLTHQCFHLLDLMVLSFGRNSALSWWYRSVYLTMAIIRKGVFSMSMCAFWSGYTFDSNKVNNPFFIFMMSYSQVSLVPWYNKDSRIMHPWASSSQSTSNLRRLPWVLQRVL